MSAPKYVWAQLDAQGRVVIPAEVRKRMKLAPGDQVAFVIEGESIGLMTIDEGIDRAQAAARKYVKRAPGRSIVDEFIAERRAEAARE